MHPQTFFHCFLLGLAAAIISVTMIVIMAKEPILNWWFRIGEKYGKTIIDGMEHEYWFYRPIWGCEKCFAGQLALWVYFFSHITANDPADWSEHGWFSLPQYNIFNHILTVCVAILSSVILSSHIQKTINENDNRL